MFISCSVLGGMSGTDGFDYPGLLAMQVASLNHIHDAGYEYVEVFHGAQPSWFGKKVAYTLSELCLKAYSVHLPKSLVSMEANTFDTLCHNVFPFVSDTGVDVIVVHPPDLPLQSSSEWQRRLEALLNIADDACCTITLETIPRAVSQVSDCVSLYHDRSFGVTVDIEHMFVMGMRISDMVESFGKKILNIHVRDSDGNLLRTDGTRNFLSLGKGNVDFRGIFNHLKKNNYSKALTVELGPSNFRKEIIAARKFMNDCLETI